eukprot:SAG22_NODE_81_length_21778_cov_38.345173_1_plen_563_part_00
MSVCTHIFVESSEIAVSSLSKKIEPWIPEFTSDVYFPSDKDPKSNKARPARVLIGTPGRSSGARETELPLMAEDDWNTEEAVVAGLEDLNTNPAPASPAAVPSPTVAISNTAQLNALRLQMMGTLKSTPGSPGASPGARAGLSSGASPPAGAPAPALAPAPVAAGEGTLGGAKVASWLSSEGAAIGGGTATSAAAAGGEAGGAGENDTDAKRAEARCLRAAVAWNDPQSHPEFSERLKKMSDWVGLKVLKKDFSTYQRGKTGHAQLQNYWKGVCGELFSIGELNSTQMLLSSFMGKLVPGSLGSDMRTTQRGLMVSMFLQTCSQKGIAKELLFKPQDVQSPDTANYPQILICLEELKRLMWRRTAIVMHRFVAEEELDLGLVPNELIVLRKTPIGKNWWFGHVYKQRSRAGYFPKNFVEVLPPPPPPDEQPDDYESRSEASDLTTEDLDEDGRGFNRAEVDFADVRASGQAEAGRSAQSSFRDGSNSSQPTPVQAPQYGAAAAAAQLFVAEAERPEAYAIQPAPAKKLGGPSTVVQVRAGVSKPAKKSGGGGGMCCAKPKSA